MKELKKFWSYGVLMLALMLMPVVSLAQVGLGGVDSISPAVSERYPANPPPAPADSAQALFSPTLAQSTVIGFGGRQWVVIGWDGEGVASAVDTATLLLANASPNKPANSTFHGSSNHYAGSNLRTAMDNFYNAITDAREQNAIVPRSLAGGSGNLVYNSGGGGTTNTGSFTLAAETLTDGQYVTGWGIFTDSTFDWYAYHALRTTGVVGNASYTGNYHPDHVAGDATVLTNEPLWALSVAESSLLDVSTRQYNNVWWLRSPGPASL